MNHRSHNKPQPLPANFAMSLDGGSIDALDTAHEHLELFSERTHLLGTFDPSCMRHPVMRALYHGLPYILHRELVAAAYFGVLLVDPTPAAWRARVQRVSRLVSEGKLDGTGMPNAANLRRNKARLRLEDSAAHEYGLADSQAMLDLLTQLNSMTLQLGLSFADLCDTRAYIARAIEVGAPNWQRPSDAELEVLATGPAYLVDYVGRSRARNVEGVAFAAYQDWLLTAYERPDGTVRATGLFPPELLVRGFGTKPENGPPRSPDPSVIAALTHLCIEHFPGRTAELCFMTTRPDLSDLVDMLEDEA